MPGVGWKRIKELAVSHFLFSLSKNTFLMFFVFHLNKAAQFSAGQLVPPARKKGGRSPLTLEISCF